MTTWIDGQLVENAAVSVRDETVLRGDGCFEAIRSYGGALFDAESHLDRLERSAAALQLALPTRGDLTAWIEKAAVASSGDAIVRILMTRGESGSQGHAFVVVEPVPDQPDRYHLKTIVAPWHPAGRAWELAGVKSLSYAPNMAASRLARAAGAHDALLTSTDSMILEGPTFTVAWIVDGVLETPDLDLGILASVTRRNVLAVAARLGIATREGHWGLERLESAEEVMALSTVKEVASVAVIDGLRFEAGPLTEALAAGFAARVSR